MRQGLWNAGQICEDPVMYDLSLHYLQQQLCNELAEEQPGWLSHAKATEKKGRSAIIIIIIPHPRLSLCACLQPGCGWLLSLAAPGATM